VEAPLDATALLERVNALAADVAGARAQAERLREGGHAPSKDALDAIAALEERRSRLGEQLAGIAAAESAAPSTNATPAERAASDRDAAAALRRRAARLSARLEAAQARLLGESLAELSTRLAGMLRHARLGKIDAAVGDERRLERRIQDLAAGRFPASMMDRLHVEGLVGDDEEYWPPEVERWADEYENYR
jgi:hypothetical protein